MRWLALFLFLGLIGCSQSQPHSHTHGTATHTHDHDEDGHDGNIEHAGPYHARLNTHLSAKDGNELDVHFETTGINPKPYALAFDKILAKAKRTGDDKEYDLVFEPAPADERPKDEKPGTCSHYVAKAPFMKDNDTITVVMKVVIREKERVVTWENFDVKKYSHKHD